MLSSLAFLPVPFVDGFLNLHPTVLRAVYPDSGLLVTPLRIITFRRHTAKIPRLGGMPEA